MLAERRAVVRPNNKAHWKIGCSHPVHRGCEWRQTFSAKKSRLAPKLDNVLSKLIDEPVP
jgi:hypothetical protein